MVIKRKKVQNALKRKGFDEVEESHHTYFHFIIDGEDTGIYTYVSRGSKYTSLGQNLLNKMAKQIKIRPNKFEQLIECTLTEADLQSIYREAGEL